MLEITQDAYEQMVALALEGYPLEVCGLIAGPPDDRGGVGDGSGAGDGSEAGDVQDDALASRFYPCTNIAASARVYTIDPKDHLRAELDADDHDLEINGVVHSHTHSEAYPSPTDVGAAPDPSWHYVIITLKRETPHARSYRIIDGQVTEEPIVVV
ncbi:MAG: M67 family metallopeptidase [Ilumatobacteraceae bacterium]